MAHEINCGESMVVEMNHENNLKSCIKCIYMNTFDIRINCIICNNLLSDSFFTGDLSIPISCYCNDNKNSNDIFIPYNIYTCSICKTTQTKYLGDLDIIYKTNHAESIGSIMQNLHKLVCKIIEKYIPKIKNITEIGSAKGILSSIILEEYENISKYYIIEPSFIGNKKEKQIIINDFFENVNIEKYSDSNTIIISHVFEHFYNPIEILDVIKKNENIEYLLLVWPDLEHYKDNNIYQVLNTEHTFYVDNNFISLLFNNYSFEKIEEEKYENHSVIYVFKRNNNLKLLELINENYSIDSYFNNLLNKKQDIIDFIEFNKNNNKKICIWPTSVHTQFLLMITEIKDIDFVLDNSPNKIGKYIYGYNLECKSFEDNCNNEMNAIILNGGCFNKEVINKINVKKEQIYILNHSNESYQNIVI